MGRARGAQYYRRRSAKSPNAGWRHLPMTEAQWQKLRKIGNKTGQWFDRSLTRGEASDIISGGYGDRRAPGESVLG